MEAKTQEAKFTLKELSERLKDHIHQEKLFTENGAIDYNKLANQTNVNQITLRNLVTSNVKSCAWATWNKLADYLGIEVVVRENQAA